MTWIDILAMHTNEADDSRKRKASDDTSQEAAGPTDDWIGQRLLSYLANSEAKDPTVLELRRGAFEDPLPAVPQLNRVLYGLKSEDKVRQLPCQGPSKKPRWSLN